MDRTGGPGPRSRIGSARADWGPAEIPGGFILSYPNPGVPDVLPTFCLPWSDFSSPRKTHSMSIRSLKAPYSQVCSCLAFLCLAGAPLRADEDEEENPARPGYEAEVLELKDPDLIAR